MATGTNVPFDLIGAWDEIQNNYEWLPGGFLNLEGHKNWQPISTLEGIRVPSILSLIMALDQSKGINLMIYGCTNMGMMIQLRKIKPDIRLVEPCSDALSNYIVNAIKNDSMYGDQNFFVLMTDLHDTSKLSEQESKGELWLKTTASGGTQRGMPQ